MADKSEDLAEKFLESYLEPVSVDMTEKFEFPGLYKNHKNLVSKAGSMIRAATRDGEHSLNCSISVRRAPVFRDSRCAGVDSRLWEYDTSLTGLSLTVVLWWDACSSWVNYRGKVILAMKEFAEKHAIKADQLSVCVEDGEHGERLIVRLKETDDV